MSTFGIDYAWSRPTIANMKAAGVTFVCRYLSHDTTGKNLSRQEAETLSAAGLGIVCVWETTTSRALSGRSGGVVDANYASEQASILGMPDARPIYFAVDFDSTAGQQTAINEYMDGAASVIGRGRIGMYGGYGPINRAFNAGKITYGWQTYAWSGGKWDERAHLQQYQNGMQIGGASVDYNRAMVDDYGQWMVGDSMAFTQADKDWMLKTLVPAMWKTDGIIQASDDGTVNTHWTPAFHVYDIGKRLRLVATAVAGLDTPDVDEAAIVAGVLAGLSPETLADAIATHLGPDVAAGVLDALRGRLEA